MSRHPRFTLLTMLAFGLVAVGCPAGPPAEPLTISFLEFEQTVVRPGATIAILAEATGGDGSPSYEWTAEAGTLADAGAAETTWTAPEVTQLVKLTITASAGEETAVVNVDIVVGPGIDHDGDGFSTHTGDCDDTNAAIYPGAPDVQDGFDNDCDGQIDEGAPESDDDGDGFSEFEGDCNDGDAGVYPGADEVINGVDDDCNGMADDGTDAFDDDGDGYSEDDGDCNDANTAVSPVAAEFGDGLDNNCNGQIDEGTAAFDDDGDGYNELQGDCDDDDAAINPAAVEVPNAMDDDCDGVVDNGPFAFDIDGDGWSPLAGDCDDADFYSYPGAPEWADGADNDCDGSIDETMDTVDDDGDGFAEADGDCDDFAANVYPGATEVDDDPDVDNDCDGLYFVNPPYAVATAGATSVQVGSLVNLDGSGSFDPDNDAIQYYWYFDFQPINSEVGNGDIIGGATDTASFIPDIAGTWTVALIVNDGLFNSAPSYITLDVTP